MFQLPAAVPSFTLNDIHGRYDIADVKFLLPNFN